MGNQLSSRKRSSRFRIPFFGFINKRKRNRQAQTTTTKIPIIRLSPPPSSSPPSNIEHESARETHGIVPASLDMTAYTPLVAVDPVEVSEPQALLRPPAHRQLSWETSSTRVSQAISPSTISSGLFSGASNFKVDQPIMGEYIEVVQNYHDPNFLPEVLLEKMKIKHVTIEAEFDSSDRENPPRCHPGTRKRFLDQLKAKIRSGTRIMWLFGPAGVGKSAIMQTLADTLAPSMICLSFFFSRANRRDDTKKLFPTLAYRLAIASAAYRRYLKENLANDPDFLAKTLEEQFKRLFVDPIANKWVDTFPPCVVVLDGLDESEGSHAQVRILDLIRHFVERDPKFSIPIFWVIASRAEPHLRTSFSQIKKKLPDDSWKIEVPIDTDEVAQEVETYIRAAFMQIKEDFSDFVPNHWPPEADLLKVATTSYGLFVFATTCIAYIADQNPVHRLNHIVWLIDHYREELYSVRPNLPRNPFELLDILYSAIMDNIPADSLPTTRALLGFYLLEKEIAGRPPFFVARKILGYDEYEAYAALRGLHSVLRLPPREDFLTPLKFLHASFADFLRDESRSKKHWIDMSEEIRRVWRCYVRIFRQLLMTVRPALISLTLDQLGAHIWGDALLRNHRKHNWLSILATRSHALPCQCALSYHLVLDNAELIGVFKEFSSVLFCRELQEVPSPRDVSIWLYATYRHAPPGFLQQMYRRQTTLDKFTGFNFDCILRGLSLGRPAYYSVLELLWQVDSTDLSDAQWEQIKLEPMVVDLKNGHLKLRDDWRVLGDLKHLRKETQMNYEVRIIGMGKEGLWAIISGKFRNRGRIVTRVVFPYVEFYGQPTM